MEMIIIFFYIYVFFIKTVSDEAFLSALKTAVAGAQASSAIRVNLVHHHNKHILKGMQERKTRKMDD